MDESVVAAMTRWPNVPAVSGWLSLDMHGHWRLKGEPVTHPGLVDFINRNYDRDDEGRWYFQNGPQRVYVSLEYMPLVLHVDGDGTLFTHTNRKVERITAALVDDEGNLLLDTEHGPALVASDALPRASDWLVGAGGAPLSDESLDAILSGNANKDAAFDRAGERLSLEPVGRAEVPDRFRFTPDPQPPGNA
jgi:hypothetical protein